MEQQTQDGNRRGPGRNKRIWTKTEDLALIEALIELTNAGTHKADNGFRPGHLAVLEEALAAKISGCCLKARPHIESRIKTLKESFNVIHNMIHGNTIGFGWDEEKKCVTAKPQVWANYIAVHKKAERFRNKPFEYYDSLSIVFGKERAKGVNAYGADGMVAENEINLDVIEIELNDFDDDISCTQSQRQRASSSFTLSNRKRKANARFDQMASTMENVAKIMGEGMRAACKEISMSFTSEFMKKRNIINDALSKMKELTTRERHRVLYTLAKDEALTETLLGLPNDEMLSFLRDIVMEQN